MSDDDRNHSNGPFLNRKIVGIQKAYESMIREIREHEAREHGHEVGQESGCGICVAKSVLES